MLRNLLSPLRSAGFEGILSPRSASNQTSTSSGSVLDVPEDFQRDVRMDIMRKTTEELKEQSSLLTLVELNELMDTILRVMDEDSDTVQVFRELDGVLGLLSALQVLSASISSAPSTSQSKAGYQMQLEGIKFVFQILSHIMRDQKSRLQFQDFSGYSTISDILLPIISLSGASSSVLGFLLAFSLSDFSRLVLSHFSAGNAASPASLLPSPILRNPRVISILVSLLPFLPSYSERVALAAVILQLAQAFPVNLAAMAQPSIDILGQLIPLVFPSASNPNTLTIDDGVRPLLLKTMRLLLPMSCSVASARVLFERVVRSDRSSDAEILSLLAAGFDIKGTWPSFVMLGPKGQVQAIVERAVGAAGFTFMTWVYLPRPTNVEPRARLLMTLTPNPPVSSRFSIRISIRSNGSVQYETSSSKGHVRFSKVRLKQGEWVHLGVVHTKSGSVGEATCSVFLNGQLAESISTAYPKVPSSLQMTLGAPPVPDIITPYAPCILIGPTHLLSYPLSADLFVLPRVLGSQYTGRFQSGLVRFLTYDGATTLNIHLSSLNQSSKSEQNTKHEENVGVVKALKNGLYSDGQTVHAMLPGLSVKQVTMDEPERTSSSYWTLDGDAECIDLVPLHSAVYAIGGCSLGLRLADMASTPEELCDSVRVLFGMLSESWRNSEEMDSYHGYDVLTGILRRKASLITEDMLSLLLAFVGADRNSPERSVIANSVAYRAVILDFDLWSRTDPAVQTAHLAHFHLFLSLSGHRRFNIKHRYAKLNIIRLILYSIRFTPYSEDILPSVVDAIKSIILYHFSADNTIKPLVAYLATTLHQGADVVRSPLTIASTQVEHGKPYRKAILVLDMFVSVLRHPDHLSKFCSSLPVARVLLLMLGEYPTPEVAAQIVTLLGLITRTSSMFSRKFELANGWAVLRCALPACWDASLQGPVFEVLLGQTKIIVKSPAQQPPPIAQCPFILPAILDSLFINLVKTLLGVSRSEDDLDSEEALPMPMIAHLDSLTEALLNTLNLHPNLFRSKIIINHYVKGIDAISKHVHVYAGFPQDLRSLLDKVVHLTIMLSLDEHISDSQKRELKLALRSFQDSTSDGHRQPNETTSLLTAVYDFHGSSLARQTFVRTSAWREKLVTTEKERARKQLQDQREWREQVDQQTAWKVATEGDRGLWSSPDNTVTWRVDETEGPFRVRKKLERANDDFYVGPSRGDEPSASFAETSRSDRHIAAEIDDAASVLHTDSAPWADTDTNLTHDNGWDEDMVDDKHRRVRRYLEPGDVIQAVYTVYKIVGIDSSPGLLVLGRSHIYLLEGLVESKEGEIIDARDAPKDLLTIPSGTVVEFKRHRPEAKWAYDDVGGFSKRTCLFRDVALELYLKDNRSILLVFGTSAERQSVYTRLGDPRHRRRLSDVSSAFPLRAPLASAVSSIGARFAQVGPEKVELESATRRWQARELSNYAYLAIINQAAGRTPNDITQYPVYPWVVQDYESKILDLYSEKTFRDLASPMGALTPQRREAASERYEAQMDGEAPFHYGTHFSSSMIVCHFLLRLEPFTRMFRELQGGSFDLPERLFREIGKAWNSAARDSRGDVRELIPEFFTCPEFLENINHLQMGTLQDGQTVDSVVLPPWAKGDPLLFITLHRQALESERVSRLLPKWIDLVFGYKQRDVSALNVYHPLTYEGTIDLEGIAESWEREAAVGAIHNFGQTPRQVFKASHPERYLDGATTLPLGTAYGISEHHDLLTQSEATSRKLDDTACALYIDAVSEKVIPCPPYRRLVPHAPHESAEWSPLTLSLCLCVDRKVVCVEEETSVSAAAFYDNRILVTGGDDSTVSVWRIIRRDQPYLHLISTMRGHRGRINCVAVSKAWAMLVTGSEDGLVIVWDINRMRYVRSMSHESAVQCIAIGPAGEIASSSRTALSVHTINGRLIASVRPPEPVTSLAFLLREYNPVPVLASSCGDEIKLWSWIVDQSIEDSAIWRLVLLRALKCRKSNGQAATVTALEFVGETLYHGDDQGLVYAWTLPDY